MWATQNNQLILWSKILVIPQPGCMRVLNILRIILALTIVFAAIQAITRWSLFRAALIVLFRDRESLALCKA